MTYAEQQQIVTRSLGDYLAEHLENHLPVTIAFRPYSLGFEVYGTKNKGVMRLSYRDANRLSLQLGIYRQGTDRLFSNFLPSAGAEEMLRYLRDPASHQEWLEAIAHLSEKADDFWD